MRLSTLSILETSTFYWVEYPVESGKESVMVIIIIDCYE